MLLGNVLDLGTPSDNTVTGAKLNNDIISAQTELAATPADTDELLISDAGTIKRIDYSYLKQANTPAFHAQSTAGTSVSSSDTKIAFNVEIFDTAGAYDHSTNYRFTVPSGQAGKYFFYANVRVNSATDFDNVQMMFYKNGSVFNKTNVYNTDYNTVQNSTIADLSAGDYMEVYCYFATTSTIRSTQNENNFFGYKLIGA